MKHSSRLGLLGQVMIPDSAPMNEITRALGVHLGPFIGTGLALVVGSRGELQGVITDADLRRAIAVHGVRKDLEARDIMRKDFAFVREGANPTSEVTRTYRELSDAKFTTSNPLKALPVIDGDGRPVALIESSGQDRTASVHRDVAIVIGQGYVGATLTAAFSEAGIRTFGVESSESALKSLNQGQSHASEPGLNSALSRGLHAGRLSFHSSLEQIPEVGLGRRRHFVVSVGTPVMSGVPRLDALEAVVVSLSKVLRKGDVVALRSTVPLGTTADVSRRLEGASGLREGIDFFVVSAPERTVEGAALREIKSLPQIVGGISSLGTQLGADFFRTVATTVVEVPSAEFAELVKLASNSFRDYLFAFSNYLAQVSIPFNIDVNELIRVSNLGYTRNNIASPSPGVGGPCLAKDPYMMPGSGGMGEQSTENLVVSSRRFNEEFVQSQIDRLINEIGPIGSVPIAAVGLAFKGSPPTNDTRGSTALQIAEAVAEAGADVCSWDAVLGDGACGLKKIFARSDFRVVLILNNHPSNEAFVLNLISSLKSGEILVYDPWRLVAESLSEVKTQSIQRITYMTLSSKINYDVND